jgi:hypothetical protein
LHRLQDCSVETLRTEIVAVRRNGISGAADQG